MRLIDADKLKAYLQDNYVMYDHTLADIDAQPTVDAELVRRGKWAKGCYTLYNTSTQHKVIICSECGFNFPDGGYLWDYCPRCGARMDGE